ncbi:MAG TPA: nucleoside 2-deoxyribosyltransferase domain-containing protein [Patescibacteria group bacterium]|nr:nucleoside 2-deoxyribosyltransferase domain-containing protein [Patescibacteria group bacterium]
MQIIYAKEEAPQKFSKSIFLAGPSPRNPSHPNWRPEALTILEDMGYDGTVFLPIPRDGDWGLDYDAQVDWETRHLNMSDVVVFWVPRDMRDLPALTTNVEFGMFYDSGKAVLGYPEGACHMHYLAHHARKEQVPIHGSLESTLHAAVEKIGTGAERTGGERMVPFHIWCLPHFQRWLKAQKEAGNRLDGARLLWSFRVGPAQAQPFPFAFALHVDVYITSEGRHKTNEFIIARPDIATIVAYRKRFPFMDTDVVLIREFRSPAGTTDGFIHEVPGGSSWKSNEDFSVLAVRELNEETGFSVDPTRLRPLGARQLCGTLSVHQAHVFACEVTEGELISLRQQKEHGMVCGVVEDTERTYVEVYRLGDLLDSASNEVDWSMIGMILTAVKEDH